MTHSTSTFTLRRLGALILCVLFLCCQVPFSALAGDVQPPIVFALNWMEGDVPMEALSTPVTEPGYENSYWLYVPATAQINDAQLSIRDTYMQYAAFSILNGTPLSQLIYSEAGLDLNGPYMDVMAYDAAYQVVAQLRLYLSTQTDMPAAPAPTPVTVQVPVYYADAYGNIVTTGYATVSTGDNPVYADDGMMPGYIRTSDGTAWVSVDYSGNCYPAGVTFYYQPASVTIDIDVVYCDQNNYEIARTRTQVSTGDNYVAPDASMVPAGYALTSYDSVYVNVDANGYANPGSVVFYCMQQTAEIDLPVSYVDAYGNVLASDFVHLATGEHWVAPKAELVPAGYALTSYDSVFVSVDYLGNANPNTVTFYCNQQTAEIDLPVSYVDAYGNVLASDFVHLATGEHWVAPKAELVPAGYALASYDNVFVSVDYMGNANPSFITFTCNQQTAEIDLPVSYVDAYGNVLASDFVHLATGEHWIAPKAELIPAGYALASYDSVFVSVDYMGNTNPSFITFTCNQQTAEVDLPVSYVDEYGNVLASDFVHLATGEHWVAPKAELVPAGYALASYDSAFVSVDYMGNANPGFVTFTCSQQTAEIDLPVSYVDAYGNVLASDFVHLATGEHWVAPKAELVPAGYALTSYDSVFVSVDYMGNANPNTVTFYCNQQTAEIDLPVSYVDAYGNVLASDFVHLATGEHWVAPKAELVPAGYALASYDSVFVSVDYMGNANPNTVTFYCNQQTAEIDLPVSYVDAYGNVLASDFVRLATGEHWVTPKAELVPAGYALASYDSVFVSVDYMGNANPNTVTFYCNQQTAEIDLPVSYVDAYGNVLASESVHLATGEHCVAPKAELVPAGYALASYDSVFVSVDYMGNANPNTVTFYCNQQTAEIDLPVSYVDAYGNVLASDFVRLATGEHWVAPKAELVPAGYALASYDSVFVSVDYMGNANPSFVTFTCNQQTAEIDLPVSYVDAYGNVLASDFVRLATGEHWVAPKAELVPAGYALSSYDSVFVSVDYMGNTNPNTVTFYCNQQTAEIDLPVSYVDAYGNVLASDFVHLATGEHWVAPKATGAVPARDALASYDSVFVSVDYMGNANPGFVTFTCNQQTAEIDLPVSYVDAYGNVLASDFVRLATGEHWVAPKAELVPVGYALTSYDSVFVSVDYMGNANPGFVTFTCNQQTAEIDLPVSYVDAYGNVLASDFVRLATGEHWVAPKAELVPAGYALASYDSVFVSVDYMGNANPGFVTFACTPAIVTVPVDVFYYDQNGAELAHTFAQVTTGSNTVQPDAGMLPPGYVLVSTDSVGVTVDNFGLCTPARVDFTCAPATVQTEVTILYLHDQSNQQLAAATATVQTGNQLISPDPALVPEGYVLATTDSINVTVDSLGNCTPATVVFYCTTANVNTFVDVIYTDPNGTEISRATVGVSTGDNLIIPDANMAPAGYVLSAMAQPVHVTVDNLGNCTPGSVTFACDTAVVEVPLDVIYCDQNGLQLLRAVAQVKTGVNVIEPDASLVPAGYVLSSVEPVTVTVDHYGYCLPASVTFTCIPATVTTRVVVNYLYDLNGEILAVAESTVTTGDNQVAPDDSVLPAGYVLATTDSVPVQVDSFGVCTPASVTFYCTDDVVETAVNVIYLDESNNELARAQAAVRTGSNAVAPDAALVPQGYALFSADPVTVQVDRLGVCTPAEVVFYCTPQSVTVDIPVLYYDAQGALLNETRQSVTTGQNTVTADPALVPENMLFTGDTSVTVSVDHLGNCTPSTVAFLCQAPAPTATPVPAQAEVTVRYVNAQDETIHFYTVVLLQGENTVIPDGSLLPDGYTLENDVPVIVTVDAQGAAAPAEVTFRCQGAQPEATPAPVEVTIHYLNENDQPVASSSTVTCYGGINHVKPQPADLQANYFLTGEEVQYVVVDENGAEPAFVIFRYTYQPPVTPTPTLAPAPKIALVPVHYKLLTGETFYIDNTFTCTQGENTVTPAAQYVPETYQLHSAASVTVTVDENGVAAPAAVEFVYASADITRNITLYFRDASGNDVASPQVKTCYVGMNVLTCEPLDLRAGYTLLSNDSVSVTLDMAGNLTMNGQTITEGVTFLYAAPPTATPAPTPLPYELNEMSGYCYPKSDTINFRSEPSTSSDHSVLRVLRQSDLGKIEGYVINERNERWYVVTIDDQTGFLRENVVRLLTTDEINALFGYTPTPAPTRIPDGVVIDRWGVVNTASVNFRSSIGGQRRYLMSKGSHLFVYMSETVNGETWYHARFSDGDGHEDGYVMAKFVDLLSAEESFLYQQSLPTPMPVRTPVPTASPVPTPTLAPLTPPPTQTIAPTVPVTATPAPYTGYALTTRAVDLRTGVTVGDTTLVTLPANSLVYLWGQAFIDGNCWHSAESLQMNMSGYLPDSVLRRITSEEAAPYLNALQPQTSPTPVPSPQPAPYAGYAVTAGNNVLMRAYANTNAEIINVLTAGEVVWVLGQEYVDGDAWQIARFNGMYGYIRGDQLRMMSAEEQRLYEETLRTATPPPQATPTVAPITQQSMSSYGYVTNDNVRLRDGAGTDKSYLRMMNRYAFALVLGTEEVNGKVWYHINHSGTEGYVMSDYFKVLTIGELTDFLTSDEYLDAQDTPVGNTGSANPGSGLTSYEDFNKHVWQNPSATASYEPFSNLIATPTPDVEAIQTPSPTPTVSVLPTTNFEPYVTPTPNANGGAGNGILWLGLAAVGIIAGGGVYAYSIHRQNQRRAAQRAAQRKAMQQQAMRNAAYQRPQTQYPQQPQQPVQSQTQKYQSVFTPPTPGSTTPPAQSADSAGTTVRRRRSDRHQG